MAHRALGFVGLLAGPVAWFISLTTKYALTPWTCAHNANLTDAATLLFLLLAIAGGIFSWGAMRGATSMGGERAGRPNVFLGVVGLWAAALFSLAIVLQGAAILFLDGCER